MQESGLPHSPPTQSHRNLEKFLSVSPRGLAAKMSISTYTLPPHDHPSRGRLMFSRVNTKATVRFHMQDLTSIIPPVLHSQLRASTYYAERSNSLVIHADGSRKQNDNIRECFHKLQLLIKASGKTAVKGETSPEQAAKVKNLYVPVSVLISAARIRNANGDIFQAEESKRSSPQGQEISQ